MNFFETLIAPFIYIIKHLFLLSYGLTENYGLAIILLSFFISLLLLPVFILIEKSKKKDDLLKQKMKPLLDEIKRCYKGQERYYYIRTLNRQHNYSSFKSLIPILSLLLQIPFFIAAYQFLEHYEPLKGVSFLFINDLNSPDALLGIVNILPIAMTLVNLATVYVYTRNGNKSERNQMIVVAGLFLVLLFNLPAGLVMYWTMNNVFSFFRLFITNPEVFKRRNAISSTPNVKFQNLLVPFKRSFPRLLKIGIVLLVFALLSQLNWAMSNNFNNIFLRLFYAILATIAITVLVGLLMFVFTHVKVQLLKINIKPPFFYSALFLTIYFYLASEFYFTGLNTNLNLLSLLLLIPLQVVGFLYVLKRIKSTSHLVYLGTIGVLVFLFIGQVFNLIVLLSEQAISLSFFSINITVENSNLTSIIIPGIIFSIVTVPYYMLTHRPKIVAKMSFTWSMFVLAILYLMGIVFLWNPLTVYASSPETFSFPAVNIIKTNFDIFIVSLLIPLVIFLFSPQKWKRVWLFIFLFFVAIAFINSSLIPINLGSLQESRFSEQEKLAAPIYRYILEAFVLIGLFIGILWLHRKQFAKSIVGTLLTINVLVVFHSLYAVYNTQSFFTTGRESQTISGNVMRPIPFSKEKENVVYFVIDAFQGWFIKQIMEDEPTLKDIYSGFIWYPNMISMSNYTHASIPSMLGGEGYSVDQMNANDSVSIKEKMLSASHQFVEKVKSRGFHYSTEYLHYSDFNDSIVDNTIPLWKEQWKKYGDHIHLGIFHEIWYKRLYENALFNSVPLFLKPKIYNNQEWLAAYSKNEKPVAWKFTWYNFVRLLPFISDMESEQPNFIYLHSGVAHNPWNIVTDQGEFVGNVTPYDNNRWTIKQLSKWILWMKENQVYDNTKIIFISDHGASWGQFDGELDFESPIICNEDTKLISDRNFLRLNPLLLVKDFYAQGELREDWRIMSNADAPAIVFNENDPTKGEPLNRTLDAYWTIWASKMMENNTMQVHKHYVVNDNVFDLKNWKVVE